MIDIRNDYGHLFVKFHEKRPLRDKVVNGRVPAVLYGCGTWSLTLR